MIKNTIKMHYSVKEVADLLKVSRVTIFKKIKNGQIKAEKVGRNYVISADYIRDYVLIDLSDKIKVDINLAVARVIKDYGNVLQRLGRE